MTEDQHMTHSAPPKRRATNKKCDMQRVEEAALAVIDPTIDATTRSAASKFLEEWATTHDSWAAYPTWLLSNSSTGTKLLGLQMLQTKIRKELPYHPSPLPTFLIDIRQALESIANHEVTFRKPCCICLAALMIRVTPLPQLCSALLGSLNPISLRILENIPLELKEVSTLTNTAVATELQTVANGVLVALLPFLQQEDELAFSTLRWWVEVARISLSQLMSTNVLAALLPCLTKDTSSEHAAMALHEAILVPSDSCTHTRRSSCAMIASSFTHWNYDGVWTGPLLATFCIEEIDTLVTQPATELLPLLLRLQRHDEVAVRTAMLEVWLTVSEKPLEERHQNWRQVLYQQVTLAIIETVSIDEDPDDRESYRRLVKDVLETCYFLLGDEYFNLTASAIPNAAGSALFCLAAVVTPELNRDIASLKRHNLPFRSLPACHETNTYLGAYAHLWAVQCSPRDLFSMLQYLGQARAAKSIHSVLVRCSTILKQEPEQLNHCVRWLVENALNMENDEEGEELEWIVQGCTRTGVDGCTVVLPVVRAFADHPTRLLRALMALQVVLRFGESPDKIALELLPLLEKASDDPACWEQWLETEKQIIKSAPTTAALRLNQTIGRVLACFTVALLPSCLSFLSAAVESLSAADVAAFRQLLDHVAKIAFEALTNQGPAALASLVKTFFELNQRYLLFCPTALVTCEEFPSILQCSLQCLEGCRGERESSRSILNFLTKMFGWRSLRFGSPLATNPRIEQELARYGSRTVFLCMSTLFSGPQALSSPAIDCIVAVVNSADPQRTRQWLQSACWECEADLSKHVIELLIRFTDDGMKPRAKMLLADFSMIQKGQLSKDSLVSYNL